jgi:DNA-binding transcriptional LysR family regulator
MRHAYELPEPMEFHQLTYFVAAAETLNMSRAAERVHVSQPAMSRQIALLEDELGVFLFDRIKKRIHLTEAGRFFLPRARQLLCDAETSLQQVREQFGRARRTLRLGFIGPFLDDLVAPTVKELKGRSPRIGVSLFDLPPRAQLERLRNHELDAAILGNISDDLREQFTIRRLSRHRMAVALPESHPLARRRAVALADLRDADWISLGEAFFPGRREFLRQACAQAGFEPRIAAEVDSVPLMLGAVAVGDGVALVPGHSRKLPHEGCVFVAITAPAPAAELLLVTSKRLPSPELTMLADLLAGRARTLSED